MSAVQLVIMDLYRQVGAPGWASLNLDALADVLRDLSWLPAGPVRLHAADLDTLTSTERAALLAVLDRAVRESVGSLHPVHVDVT